MDRLAETRFPIHELLGRRRSPVAFAPTPVSRETLGSLLEAARWAPSSFNDQPWSFVVARREEGEAFERLASVLVPGNRAWAERAPVLLVTVARLAFARNGKPNRHAFHDVGLAAACLTFQAEALGLHVHQMAGLDVERARDLLAIPAGHEAVTAIAIGYPGDPAGLPEELRRREEAPRVRKPLAEVAFAGRYGEPYPL